MSGCIKIGGDCGGLDYTVLFPVLYERDRQWAVKTAYSTAANRYTLVSPSSLAVNVGGKGLMDTAHDLSLNNAANWAELTPVNGTVAANRAGKDVYIYACDQGSSVPKILFSFNSTIPTGYTALNSRKIGGFHCLCVAVGTIAGHSLTGFVAGDILPASVWDLNFRPKCSPEGMVYSSACNKWVDIYLASGTGATTASVNGSTITDTRTWNDFADDGAYVGKCLLDDGEFQAIASGSNEQTNIVGSSDPVTTGGHVDTNSRRMISHIGCEDCCGVAWQWLRDQSYQYDLAAWSWKTIGGSKGQFYSQGTYGDVKLLAGAAWANGSSSGSRSRSAAYSRWIAYSAVGGRFRAEHKER